MKQKELAKRFAVGYSEGHASNMEIKVLLKTEVGRWTGILGYSHALYAIRDPNGNITIFEGWRGYSVTTTSKHLPAIRAGCSGVKSFSSRERPGPVYDQKSLLNLTLIGYFVGD